MSSVDLLMRYSLSHDAWGVIAGIVSLAGFVPYLISVARRQVRVRVVTWAIWTVISASLCASYRCVGPATAVWAPLSQAIGPALVLLVGFRHGTWRWTTVDRASIAAWIGAGAIGLWSGLPLHALLLLITVDLLGSVPMITEAFRRPDERDNAMWALFLVGGACNLAALARWDVRSLSYPLYMALIPFAMCCLMLRTFTWQRFPWRDVKQPLTVLPAE